MDRTGPTIDEDLEKRWNQVVTAIFDEIRELEDEGTDLPILDKRRDYACLENIPDKVCVKVSYKRNEHDRIAAVDLPNGLMMEDGDSGSASNESRTLSTNSWAGPEPCSADCTVQLARGDVEMRHL